MKARIKLTNEQRTQLLAALPPGAIQEAANHFGVTYQAMMGRVSEKRKGWYCKATFELLTKYTQL